MPMITLVLGLALAQQAYAADPAAVKPGTTVAPPSVAASPRPKVKKVRLIPYKKPVMPPLLPRGRISGTATDTQWLKIVPPAEAKKAAEPYGFRLSQAGAGRLTLSFYSTSPNVTLDRRSDMTIELDAPEPMEVEPSVITKDQWPVGNVLAISYKGAPLGQKIKVQGKAAYLVCDPQTKKCQKHRSPIVLEFVPK